MLEKIDLTKKMEKDEYQRKISVLERKLAQLQRACRNLNIPIMIAFEGFGASGKGRYECGPYEYGSRFT